ncbi:MAG: hypothetical protein ACYSW0_16900 [Planctomycetota bacterium]|jgi:hypothetical protein
MFFERYGLRITKTLLVVAAVLFFVAGCGPGQPFEIEGLHAQDSTTPAQVAAAR